VIGKINNVLSVHLIIEGVESKLLFLPGLTGTLRVIVSSEVPESVTEFLA
jgi:hypothetical protein